jgi:hypothetical protein
MNRQREWSPSLAVISLAAGEPVAKPTLIMWAGFLS